MIIEPDTHYYDAEGLYRWSPEARALAWEACFERFEALLGTPGAKTAVIMVGIPGAGKNTWAGAHDRHDVVIFDGVFSDADLRRRAVEICRRQRVPVVAVWLDTDWETCLARNARRSPDRRVPLGSLEGFRRMLLAHPPSTDEGFGAVERMRGPGQRTQGRGMPVPVRTVEGVTVCVPPEAFHRREDERHCSPGSFLMTTGGQDAHAPEPQRSPST